MTRAELRMENLQELPQLKSLQKLVNYAIQNIENGICQASNIDMMVAYAKKAVIE